MSADPTLDLATGLNEADRRRAALAVCSYAHDASDAALLLEALGLTEEVRADRERLAG